MDVYLCYSFSSFAVIFNVNASFKSFILLLLIIEYAFDATYFSLNRFGFLKLFYYYYHHYYYYYYYLILIIYYFLTLFFVGICMYAACQFNLFSSV